MRYSAASLLLNAVSGHRHWPEAWTSREPEPEYDAVVIGGGGHGLACAYYLAKEFGVGTVAVLEKGWIGGGATGRNTTNVRSDYLYPESAALYDFSLRLYEGLSRELDFNIMLSQRGFITLIHNPHQLEQARHKANALNCNGVDAMLLSRDEVKRRIPLLNVGGEAGWPEPRYPVTGAFLQPRGGTIRHDAVAWSYARGADRHGVHIIENCEVTGFERQRGRITAIRTSRGVIGTGKVGVAVAGHSSGIAGLADVRLPLVSMTLQAMVSEPLEPVLDSVVLSPATAVYVNQSDKGEMVMGGALDLHPNYTQRGNFPVIEEVVSGAVEMFPALGHVRLMRHWGGVIDVAPDSSPILGATPVENLYIDCGWGTGGFKAVPVAGYMLAHAIATGRPHRLAEPFALDRFVSGRLIDEGAAAGIAH